MQVGDRHSKSNVGNQPILSSRSLAVQEDKTLQLRPPAPCAFKVHPGDGRWSFVTCAVHSSNLSLKAAHLRK
jgi:hypothetical protein